MASDKRIHHSKWTKLAKQVLKEENHECYFDGCDNIATTVDHILPSSKYPDLFYVRDNLRAACGYHNFGKQDKTPGEQRNTWLNDKWFASEYIKQFKERKKQ